MNSDKVFQVLILLWQGINLIYILLWWNFWLTRFRKSSNVYTEIYISWKSLRQYEGRFIAVLCKIVWKENYLIFSDLVKARNEPYIESKCLIYTCTLKHLK